MRKERVSFHLRRKGKRDAARVEHKENRRIGCAGEVVAARCFRCAAHAVIIAHHTLEDGEVMAFAVSREQAAHGFLACEEEVEIGPGEAEQLAVKTRIDVVRPAFERGRGGPFFEGAAVRRRRWSFRLRCEALQSESAAGSRARPPSAQQENRVLRLQTVQRPRRNKPGDGDLNPLHLTEAEPVEESGRFRERLDRHGRYGHAHRRVPFQKEAQNFLELPAASADESGVGRGEGRRMLPGPCPARV